MINSSFTAGPEAIGQAAVSTQGQCLVRRTGDTSGPNAGFFGMLLALFARPLSTDLPVMPESNAGQPETDRGTLTLESSTTQGNAIFSGDHTGSRAAVAAPASEAPGNALPVLPGEPGIADILIPGTRSSAAPVSDGAGSETPGSSGSNPDDVGAVPARVRGLQAWALGNSAGWAKAFQVAGGHNYGDVPAWNATAPGSVPGQVKQAPANAGGVANLLAHNQGTESGGDDAHLGRIGSVLNQGSEPVSDAVHLGRIGSVLNQGSEPVSDAVHLGRIGDFFNQGSEPVSDAVHLGRIGDFFNQGSEPVNDTVHFGRIGGFFNQGGEPVGNNSHFSRSGDFLNQSIEPVSDSAAPGRTGVFSGDELIRIGAGPDEATQNTTLEAFARMAEKSSGFRQTALDSDAGRVATVLQGQGVISVGEANGVSITAEQGEAILASLMKLASAPRVEPVVTREDVENAFVFGAPQETASSAGESAPAGEVWARSVVSRVHDETVNARAAGKTSVSFDITTANGDSVRVRIAMRSNVVSGRIGVVDSETKEILALHIPELNQRLEMENLIPERFDVYVMNGDGEGSRRGQQRKAKWTADPPDEQGSEENVIYVSSETKTFEEWA